AAHRRGKARRGGAEAGSIEAEAGGTEPQRTLSTPRTVFLCVPCALRGETLLLDALSKRNHVAVRILDRELPHAVELRHDRHDDLHLRLQTIVKRDDPLDLDEERPGGADRLAIERRIFLHRGRAVVEEDF